MDSSHLIIRDNRPNRVADLNAYAGEDMSTDPSSNQTVVFRTDAEAQKIIGNKAVGISENLIRLPNPERIAIPFFSSSSAFQEEKPNPIGFISALYGANSYYRDVTSGLISQFVRNGKIVILATAVLSNIFSDVVYGSDKTLIIHVDDKKYTIPENRMGDITINLRPPQPYCMDSITLTPEENEIVSFCKVMSLETTCVESALLQLKAFLDIKENLIFERLMGGGCNAPIAIYRTENNHRIPVGVLKNESSYESHHLMAENILRALDEMKENGCECLPRILKNSERKCLVNIGGTFYSCVEYLESDPHEKHSLEGMFKLTSKFHAYSKGSSFTNELRDSWPEKFQYSGRCITNLDSLLMQWDPTIFEADSWNECVKYGNYFISESFRQMFLKLPTQLIHGDISCQNIVYSSGQPYFIDFDKTRTDARILDFACFCGWNFLEQYIQLMQENRLLDCIQNWYGDLEEIEKEYFPIIVLFNRFDILGWSVTMLKQSIVAQDAQNIQIFRGILINTISEINQMVSRIPQINELISRSAIPSEL